MGRLRINAFRERGGCALAIRRVNAVIPSAVALRLLPAVQRLASQTTGLCIVSGRAGSGRSTTLAWIIDRINDTRDANIVTIEDPIEYLHADKRSIIHQREVGADTRSYAQGLQQVLRQDADVIVIGEIRDEETARSAMFAACTGHLVLTTLSADTAGDTVDRAIELFAAAGRRQARLSLAGTLHAVVCQRLVSRSGDGRRFLAQEVLLSTGRVAERIIDPAAGGPAVTALLAESAHLGMVSFDQHLLALHQAGVLSTADVLSAASDPHNLNLRIGPDPGAGLSGAGN